MNNLSLTKLPFGLLELDTSGAVIRYSPAAERNSAVQADDVLGRQFFTEIVPNEQVRNFQARFQLFMEYGQSIDRFSASFDSDEGQIKVQIMLARISKKIGNGSERLALVRIMPERGALD